MYNIGLALQGLLWWGYPCDEEGDEDSEVQYLTALQSSPE